MTPQQLINARHSVLVDIRPIDERMEGIGFVPGSLSVPMHEPAHVDRLMQAATYGKGLILICQSGRRSGELLKALDHSAFSVPVDHLDGGLMAWMRADLPVCTLNDLPERSDSIEAFWSEFRACFVGQMVENILDFELALDPMALLERCVVASREGDVVELTRLIDTAAMISRMLGTPLEYVKRNQEWALAHLPSRPTIRHEEISIAAG